MFIAGQSAAGDYAPPVDVSEAEWGALERARDSYERLVGVIAKRFGVPRSCMCINVDSRSIVVGGGE